MITVEDLAQKCGLSLVGNKSIEVSSLAYAEEASSFDIAVTFNEKDIILTKAKVVLSEPRMCVTDKAILYCVYGELLPALSRIANILIKDGYLPNYRIPPTYQINDNSVLVGNHVEIGMGVYIAPFVTIGNDVKIGSHCYIEPNVFIGSGTEIGDGCVIHSGARIGADSFLHYEENGNAKSFAGIGRVILKNGVEIGYNAVIQRGTLSDTIVSDRVLIGNLVVVAHDVHIGSDSRIVCQSGIAGGAKLGACVKVFGQSGVINGVYMDDYSTLLAKSLATKNIRHGGIVSGLYGRQHQEELKFQAKMRRYKGE